MKQLEIGKNLKELLMVIGFFIVMGIALIATYLDERDTRTTQATPPAQTQTTQETR